MKHIATTLVAVFFATAPFLYAEDLEGKHHKHHKVQEWMSLLSDEDRAKFRAAKEQATKNPAVQAANQRRKQAETEYLELLHKEMLRIDPSLKPLLDTITDLKKRADD